MQYDIFISYKRRGTSSATAAYIYDLLIKKGYSVFFDRKEIRQGSFDKQLLTHIENAKDIFVLLEESSLDACFKGADNEAYKTDWFCMEIMHALKKNKRIIPILLDGYKMPEKKDLPDELKRLSNQNAIQLEISEIDNFYQKYLIDQQYLASTPRNIFLASQQGEGCSNFLFYCDEDCDIYEFGNLIGRIDQNVNEEHPYVYPVKYAGEHRFKFINNDTCEEQRLSISIEKDKQLYVPLTWKSSQNLWELTDEIIATQENSQTLYLWGKGLFEGSSKHEPDYERSFKCLERAAQLNCLDARNFIADKSCDIYENAPAPAIELQWLEKAAEYESGVACYLLGMRYFNGAYVDKNVEKGITYYKKAVEQDEPSACIALSDIYLNGLNGVEVNRSKGLELLRRAAEANDEEALFYLGKFYFYGKYGVKTDVSKGLEFYEKAAEAGNIRAMYNLGNIYYNGENGVKVDAKKGLEFYKKALDIGDIVAPNIEQVKKLIADS